MNNKVFTVSQLPEAVDWLFRCDGTITITLNDKPMFKCWDKPMFKCWDKMKPSRTCVGHVLTYFKNSLDVNVSRYSYKEDDIKIVINEPELDELIADF